ncbi:white-brown complex homolog 30 [Olea europaea subsp. europaea]|uniref:White-brown complex homolog 30 n=1 Tax=Olea europaea subsp. europaea TaxID=158383 RepID=A0A8S0SCA6_OLEEU|nr:white-brown complex homolog 30 [Olea europaea subsp. europaea]
MMFKFYSIPGRALRAKKVALSFILMVFYNCSYQVLSTRQARLAKSREKAARSARETAQARERWKTAKDVAKKRAKGLQNQLSRTFSRKTGVLMTHRFHLSFQAIQVNRTSAAPKDKKSGTSKNFYNQLKMIQTVTRVLICRLGTRISRSKCQRQNSCILRAKYLNTDTIKVDFEDLTITLKKKHKHLMRSVTGKFLPGRISAVMGPSGAGKTTFLSAVASKSTGCTMSGSILVNGKPDSIHCYKKITGFVPQDDIVHGNLTSTSVLGAGILAVDHIVCLFQLSSE